MPPPPRNIVICCDGTANEPKARGATNVFELVGLLRGHAEQLVYPLSEALKTSNLYQFRHNTTKVCIVPEAEVSPRILSVC